MFCDVWLPSSPHNEALVSFSRSTAAGAGERRGLPPSGGTAGCTGRGHRPDVGRDGAPEGGNAMGGRRRRMQWVLHGCGTWAESLAPEVSLIETQLRLEL